MKVLNIYRLCFVGALIVAMMVAWSIAMPSHMSHDRLAMVGGSPCCEFQALNWSYPDCPTNLNCTGTRADFSGSSGSPNLWIIIDDGHCSGSGQYCDDIPNEDCTTECTG
jgi:hypothetical protein